MCRQRYGCGIKRPRRHGHILGHLVHSVPVAPAFVVLDTMFSSSLRAALFALAATATAVSATTGLSLKVTGPEAVDGVQNLKVVTTLTNTGDETLKLLNDPRGLLSNKLPTQSFQITHQDSGAKPSFTGAVVSKQFFDLTYVQPSHSSVLGEVRPIDRHQDRWCRRFHCSRPRPVS